MATFFNDERGNSYPQIDSFCGKVKSRKVKGFRHEDKVAKFVKSDKFQKFCDREEEQIGKYGILQITICSENLEYKLGDNEVVEDFRINVLPQEGARLYKAPKFISRPTNSAEKSIFYAVSYYVCRQADRWVAELLLNDEQWLERKKVDAAFDLWAEKNSYLSPKKTEVDNVQIELPGEAFSTQAWVRPVKGKNGENRYLLCLMDNGKLLDLSAAEAVAEKMQVPAGGCLRTKFNWFRYLGDGIFSRIK